MIRSSLARPQTARCFAKYVPFRNKSSVRAADEGTSLPVGVNRPLWSFGTQHGILSERRGFQPVAGDCALPAVGT